MKKTIRRIMAGLLVFGGSATQAMSQEFNSTLGCQPQYWATSEYLMGWIKDGPNSVPLITRGSLSDDLPSALGQPGTQIMAGGDQVDYGLLQGGRITFGKWVDPCQRYGVEASGFLMGKTGPSSSFSSTSTDSTSLSVPIRLPNGNETSIFALVNNPG
ncbi:MAG: BBP7 family outer membrane beta-barrel protein, partial [Pirellula sp.]